MDYNMTFSEVQEYCRKVICIVKFLRKNISTSRRGFVTVNNRDEFNFRNPDVGFISFLHKTQGHVIYAFPSNTKHTFLKDEVQFQYFEYFGHDDQYISIGDYDLCTEEWYFMNQTLVNPVILFNMAFLTIMKHYIDFNFKISMDVDKIHQHLMQYNKYGRAYESFRLE